MAKRNLTKALVESLAYQRSGPSRQVLWDTKVRGFGCRVTPENGKQYVLLYRLDGRQHLMSLGPVGDFKSLEAARERAADFLYAMRKDGSDPLEERKRKAEANAESMTDLFELYCREHLVRRAKGTLAAFKSIWKCHIARALGSLPPGKVTRADLIRLHDKATRDGGEVTGNRCVARVRAMLTWYFDRKPEKFPVNWRNPATGIKLNPEKPRTAILDLEQQRALIASLAEEPSPWVRVWVQLALLLGLRANELTSLTWDAIDFERRAVTIGARKNGEVLVLPLPAVAVELLRSLPVVDGSPYVFPSPKAAGAVKRLSTNGIRKPFEKALERAGLPHRTLHDLRRSCGTNHARRGTSTKLISELLGNTDEVASRVYVQIASNDLRHLVEANADALLPAPAAP
jgi:integrase